MQQDTIANTLSVKLKHLRKTAGMTLEELAKKSDVSRSMLSQIERGGANPTIATLFNLSQALGLELTELIGDDSQPKNFIEHIKSKDVPHFNDSNAGCFLKILSPPEAAGQVEWYELTINHGGSLISQPHKRGAVEHLTVISGTLEVRTANLVKAIKAGEIARYNADVAHSITYVNNTNNKPATAILVVIGA